MNYECDNYCVMWCVCVWCHCDVNVINDNVMSDVNVIVNLWLWFHDLWIASIPATATASSASATPKQRQCQFAPSCIFRQFAMEWNFLAIRSATIFYLWKATCVSLSIRVSAFRIRRFGFGNRYCVEDRVSLISEVPLLCSLFYPNYDGDLVNTKTNFTRKMLII